MAICPATLKPCIDDPCYGSGCLRMPGAPMLTKCHGCGQLVALDGSNTDACECDPIEWDDDDDDEDE
jgi:hypothetical protein